MEVGQGQIASMEGRPCASNTDEVFGRCGYDRFGDFVMERN